MPEDIKKRPSPAKGTLKFEARRCRTHQHSDAIFCAAFLRHGSTSRLFRRRRALQAAAPRPKLFSLVFSASYKTWHNGGVIRFVRPRTKSLKRKRAQRIKLDFNFEIKSGAAPSTPKAKRRPPHIIIHAKQEWIINLWGTFKQPWIYQKIQTSRTNPIFYPAPLCFAQENRLPSLCSC